MFIYYCNHAEIQGGGTGGASNGFNVDASTLLVEDVSTLVGQSDGKNTCILPIFNTYAYCYFYSEYVYIILYFQFF